jgi:uncharacterized protein YjiS (DUF1127 family)
MEMTLIAYNSPSTLVEKSTLHVVMATAKMAVEVMREWRHNYRSRRELAMYTHRERNDLSFAAGVDGEIAKQFWMK